MVIFLIAGCVEIIDLESNSDERVLVITGKIANSKQHNQAIKIEYSSTVEITVEENADVSVVDGNSQRYEYSFDSESGSYVPLDSCFVGVPGETYTLYVDINGQSFQSLPETMPLRNAMDSASYELVVEEVVSSTGVVSRQNYVYVFVETTIPEGDPVFLRWDIQDAHLFEEMRLPLSRFPFSSPDLCYIVNEVIPEEIDLFQTDGFSRVNTAKRRVYRKPLDGSFERAQATGIIQSSMTREAYQYYEKVNQVANRDRSFFEVPPAGIPGNIFHTEDDTREVYGYFEVSKTDTASVHIIDLPFVSAGTPSLLTSAFCNRVSQRVIEARSTFQCFSCLEALGIDAGCFNCLAQKNSSRTRPSYFPKLED